MRKEQKKERMYGLRKLRNPQLHAHADIYRTRFLEVTHVDAKTAEPCQ